MAVKLPGRLFTVNLTLSILGVPVHVEGTVEVLDVAVASDEVAPRA